MLYKNLEKLQELLVSQATADSISRFVVGAVITKGDSFLLLRRPAHEFMGGIYELASGKVEDQESLTLALSREIKEETNLKLEAVSNYLCHFDYTSSSGKKTRQFNFEVKVNSKQEIVLSEHDEFIWCNLSTLDHINVTSNVKIAIFAANRSNVN